MRSAEGDTIMTAELDHILGWVILGICIFGFPYYVRYVTWEVSTTYFKAKLQYHEDLMGHLAEDTNRKERYG
jgi:hypothetical protein